MPPVAAGTWNSVMAVPAVKVLAATEPVPKDGAESVPRIVTVAEEGVPIVKFCPVVSEKIRKTSKLIVSSLSATPSAVAINLKVLLVEGNDTAAVTVVATVEKGVPKVVLMSLTL